MASLPSKARAVIIGGGVSGCSVAYHLAKLGWTDVVLLERKQLTSGTTWHAAGLIGQLRGSQNMTRLAKYSADLYVKLEAETGVATGMRQVGSITVALTEERKHEIYRQAIAGARLRRRRAARSRRPKSRRCIRISTRTAWSAPCTCRSTASATRPTSPWRWPRARGSAARRLSKASRSPRVHQKDGRVTGVCLGTRAASAARSRPKSSSTAPACGRANSAPCRGVNIPLHACEHFYLVTEPIPGLTRLPVLRVPDECAYYKEDAGKMMLGAFEPVAKPWGMDGIARISASTSCRRIWSISSRSSKWA